jgi:hypothetical protein
VDIVAETRKLTNKLWCHLINTCPTRIAGQAPAYSKALKIVTYDGRKRRRHIPLPEAPTVRARHARRNQKFHMVNQYGRLGRNMRAVNASHAKEAIVKNVPLH